MPFVPSDVSPIVWLDSRAGKGITQSGGALSAWVNQGSIAFTLGSNGAGSSSYVTSAINGLPAARTNSGSFTTTGINSPAATTRVMLVLAKMNNYGGGGGDQIVFTMSVGNINDGWAFSLPAMSQAGRSPGEAFFCGRSYSGFGVDKDTIGGPTAGKSSDGAYHIYAAVMAADPADQTLSIDGEIITPTINVGDGTTTIQSVAGCNVAIGNFPGVDNYDVSTVQIIAVDNAADPFDTMQRLEGWAAGVYGITLAPGHPYGSGGGSGVNVIGSSSGVGAALGAAILVKGLGGASAGLSAVSGAAALAWKVAGTAVGGCLAAGAWVASGPMPLVGIVNGFALAGGEARFPGSGPWARAGTAPEVWARIAANAETWTRASAAEPLDG
jgi:hypothetical protein